VSVGRADQQQKQVVPDSAAHFRVKLSGEKERADLSGRSGRGHPVLVCAERLRPRSPLKVNKLRRQHRWAWLSQIFLRCVGADLNLIE